MRSKNEGFFDLMRHSWGYTHKGIHKLLRDTSIAEAAKIISRVSGDTTVAYAYAFSLACERALGFEPIRAVKLERALFLERERLANHKRMSTYTG